MRRLTILLAAVGALMLVPAAQALAANMIKINVTGSGSGEIKGAEAPYPGGNPPVACNYTSPGPATGVCESEMEDLEPLGLPGFVGIGLTPVPAPGSEFVSWTINEGFGFSPCSGEVENESCFVYNEEGENAEVSAVFNAEPTPNVKLNIEEGEGTVVSNPAGISCGSECEAAFGEGEKVTLTASPAPGYAFKSWKKCDSGGVNGRQCTITAGASLKEIGAKFVKTWNLDTAKAGSGIGKYQTSPGGVLCLYNCGSAEAAFKEGSVTIKEAPAKHNHFVKWLGDCSGSSESCTLNMNEDHSVQAEFAPDTQYTLSISKTGGGQASIKSSPSGLLCGYTCGSQSASFYSGETVSIAVTLNKGTTALEWTTSAGTCTGSALTCTVTMSAAKTLVAKLS